MGDNSAIGELEIVVPLADKDVSNGADRGLGAENEAIVPIVTKNRREPIEKIHHYRHDQEKGRTYSFMIQFYHDKLILEVFKQFVGVYT